MRAQLSWPLRSPCSIREFLELVEQSKQDRLLHMQAILGLLENDGTRGLHEFRADFRSAMSRKTVHEDGVWSGAGEHRIVHLVAAEGRFTHFRFLFLSHAGPNVGVDGLRARDGFFGAMKKFNLAARLASSALGFGDDFRIRLVAFRSGDANVRADAPGDAQQRIAHVVAVADISKFQAAKVTEAFLQREKIGKRLTRVIEVRKRVDHRHVRVRGELFERFLFENARNDRVYPAFEALRHVGDRFAVAQVRDGVIEKYAGPAEARDADFECDAGAQRGLFENQSKKTAGERTAVAIWVLLHVRRELEERAYLRRAPLHAGEQIGRLSNGYSRDSVHIHLDAAIATGRLCVAALSFVVGAAGAAAGLVVCSAALARTFSNLCRNSFTSRLRIMNGGSNRMMWSCVQLISRPFARASVTSDAPSIERSIPRIKPSPRTSLMKWNFVASLSSPARISALRSRIFASSFSLSTTFRNSSAAAQMSGPPPNVV